MGADCNTVKGAVLCIAVVELTLLYCTFNCIVCHVIIPPFHCSAIVFTDSEELYKKPPENFYSTATVMPLLCRSISASLRKSWQ